MATLASNLKYAAKRKARQRVSSAISKISSFKPKDTHAGIKASTLAQAGKTKLGIVLSKVGKTKAAAGAGMLAIGAGLGALLRKRKSRSK